MRFFKSIEKSIEFSSLKLRSVGMTITNNHKNIETTNALRHTK